MVIYALVGAFFLLLLCLLCFECGHLYGLHEQHLETVEKTDEKQPETDMEDEIAKEQLRAAKEMADGITNLMTYCGKPQKKGGDTE